MTHATFPVSFAALAAAATTTTNYLADDLDFCATLVGPDREATISAFSKFATLLNKAQVVEPNGYRPFIPVEVPNRFELAHTIHELFSSAVAAVHGLESADPADSNIERFVGGILAMARDIPELERQLDLIVAQREVVAKSDNKPNPREYGVRVNEVFASGRQGNASSGKVRGEGGKRGRG